MRIISGSHKGRQLTAPNLAVRPTTDMAKTALFNILNSYFNIEELEVLDLFAGTGNISYEFASRGCRSVTSVEINDRCTAYINSVKEKLNFNNIKVVRSDVFSFLKRTGDKYNLIFADPPYDMPDIEQIAEAVFAGGKSDMLTEDGWLVIEHSKRNSFKNHSNFYQQRNYGKVNFSILVNRVRSL